MLDIQEELKREQLKAKCREMKVLPPTDIFIGIQVHKDNKLLFDDVQRGHSWTRNYWNYIFACTSNCSIVDSSFGAGYISCLDDGNSVTYQNDIYNTYGNLLTGATNTTIGIVVGTGTTAFNIDQYNLAALIDNGTGSGKFSYNASAVNSTTYTSTSKTWTIVGSRVFNNNSGDVIVVAETGLRVYYYRYGNRYWLLERSLLTPAVSVPDGAQLTVTYTIVDDFSAID